MSVTNCFPNFQQMYTTNQAIPHTHQLRDKQICQPMPPAVTLPGNQQAGHHSFLVRIIQQLIRGSYMNHSKGRSFIMLNNQETHQEIQLNSQPASQLHCQRQATLQNDQQKNQQMYLQSLLVSFT